MNVSDLISILTKDGDFSIVNNKVYDYFFPSDSIVRAGCTYHEGSYFDKNNNKILSETLPIIHIKNGEKSILERLEYTSDIWTYCFTLKGSPVYDSKGNLLMGISCSWDIIEHIENYNKLTSTAKLIHGCQAVEVGLKPAEYNMNPLNKLLTDELDIMNRLHTISTQSISKGNMNNVLDEIIETVIKITNADMGSIHLIDEPSGQISIMSNYGFDQSFVDIFNKIHDGQKLNGFMMRERISIEDIETSPEFMLNPNVQYILSLGIRSLQFTPLISRSGQLLGLLSTHYKAPHRLEEREIILLDMLARLIADITEHLQFEINKELLIQSEKEKNEALQKAIEMKDEFLSLISHEFKTPLTVINSAIQAMEVICRDELSPKTKGFLNKIRQNSYRQLRLVNNLLDITRLNAGQMKTHKTNKDIIFLTRSITDSVQIYAQQKGITLEFVSTIKIKEIGIDEEKYERILLNLLSNAIKFTPTGKTVRVSVSQKIIEKKCMVCIEVKDNGIGIPKDKQELIFERFGQVDNSLTRQAEGTGIGLSLVKMLVESQSGIITLDSQVGKGSSFNIMFQAKKIKAAPVKEKLKEITESRLVKATAVEFSDIYL